MTWPVVKLSELCRVKHGYAFKSRYFESDGPYVLLTPGSFNEKGGYRDQGEKRKFYTGDVPEGFILDEGDLIVAMTEQAPGLLGSSAWIPESSHFLHNQRHGRIVDLNERRADKRFLYYLFNTREVRHQISASATGTKVRHTSPDRIGQVAVRLPPRKTQNHISAILTAYDDLIENNRRRMALLEEAARHLYREWFVRLRFPGYEHAQVVDSSLGPIASKWRVVRLGDIATKIGSGATPRGGESAYQEEGITLSRSQNVYDERFEDDGLAFLDEDQAAELSNVVVEQHAQESARGAGTVCPRRRGRGR